MNRLPELHELPQDVQSVMKEFVRTGDIQKLDRDLDVCIEREYNWVNRITSWLKTSAGSNEGTMTYKPYLTEGGWVIQVFEGNDYIGNIANEHKSVSKV